MSETKANAYVYCDMLSSKTGATAAVVEMLTSACGAGDDHSKSNLLKWASEGNNLINLRDQIMACASSDTE